MLLLLIFLLLALTWSTYTASPLFFLADSRVARRAFRVGLVNVLDIYELAGPWAGVGGRRTVCLILGHRGRLSVTFRYW